MKVKLMDVTDSIFAGGDVPKDRFSETATDIYKIPIYANAEKDNGLYGYTDIARVSVPCVTVAARGTIGFTVKRMEPFLPVVRLITVIPDKNKITLDYLYYALRNCKPKSSGTSIPQLTVPDIKNYSFEIESISRQKEITKILDKIEILIELKREQIDSYDVLIKSRFIEMFGDPVKNPFGWHQSTLKDIGIGKLSYGSGASACEYDGKIRYIRITDIDDNGKLNLNKVSPSLIDEKYILNDGDILFARSGATVGKTYRYCQNDGKCLYAGYLIRLIPDQKKVLPDYVFYYTKTSYYEEFIASNMKVVAQPNINAQQYGDLLICIPPIDKQKEFVDFVQQVDKSKAIIQKSLDKLQLLYDSLMQKYFG